VTKATMIGKIAAMCEDKIRSKQAKIQLF